MGIKFRTTQKYKKVDIDNSIVSISSKDNALVDNLIKDYNVLVIDYLDNYFLGDTVLNEITLFAKYPELSIVMDVINVLGLSKDFLDREIKTLSSTEKIYLNILRHIAIVDKIVLFRNLVLGLDLYNKKMIIKLLNYLKSHSYIVFVCSSDVDTLYKVADYSLIATKTYLKYGLTDDIYSSVDTLIKYKLDIPTLSYITYKAKEEKNVKLFYSKDVRDIIKDIYKHV